MGSSFKIQELLELSDAKSHILSNCDIEQLKKENASKLLDMVLSKLSQVKRFQNPKGIENWNLEIILTDDEGIEFCISHTEMDLVCFLLEDDQSYDEQDVIDSFGIDSIYIDEYHNLIKNNKLVETLLSEAQMWNEDSYLHPNAIAHLQAVLTKGLEIPPFEGNPDVEAEFSFDEEEIFIGSLDDEDRPDYHLEHDQFNPLNVEESLELGVQSWADIDEEDDDWEDDLDYMDDFDEEYDDWDLEEEEWNPEFGEEDEN